MKLFFRSLSKILFTVVEIIKLLYHQSEFMELAVGTEVPVIAAQKSTLSLFCLNFFKDYDLHLFHFFVQISGVLDFICPSIK